MKGKGKGTGVVGVGDRSACGMYSPEQPPGRKTKELWPAPPRACVCRYAWSGLGTASKPPI